MVEWLGGAKEREGSSRTGKYLTIMHLFSTASLVTQSTKGSVAQYSAVHCAQSQPQNSVTSAGSGNPSLTPKWPLLVSVC